MNRLIKTKTKKSPKLKKQYGKIFPVQLRSIKQSALRSGNHNKTPPQITGSLLQSGSLGIL